MKKHGGKKSGSDKRKQRQVATESVEANQQRLEDAAENRRNWRRIVRASHHQGNANVFRPERAGRQCLAMALAGIMKASMKDPANWTTQDLNEIMMEADELYYNVRMVSDPEKIPPSGYLLVNNLSVLNNVVHLFETKFTFHFASEPEIFGYVNNDYGFGFVLATGLEELFKKHSIGDIFMKFVPLFNGTLTNVANLKTPHVPIPKLKAPEASKSVVDLNGEKLQVIVKLANIELTPEKHVYGGESWHAEGIAEERIVATGIYYFDVDNITESKLSFRQSIKEPNYEQNDTRGVYEIFGLSDEDPLNQVVGSLTAQQGRCIVFPNIYQHRVGPFKLIDKAKPGFRKILVFFLVDPTVKVVSTHNVLPQQPDWDDVQADAPSDKRRVMTRDEAESMREKLMFERKYARDEFQKEFYEREFSLCEH